MSPKYFILLLSVSFAVEIVSGTTTVLPSSTVQTYGLSATATATSTATFRATSAATFRATSTATFRATSAATRAATPSASLSYENIASTSSLKPHASVTSAVQPSSTSSPPSSSVSTVATATQSTKPPTTSDLTAKGKTIGGLEIMGFAILTILGIMVTAFAIYFFFYRKRMYPEYVNPPKVHANGQAPAEVGITHMGFVGDAGSPTKVTAPEPEVKVVIGPEVTPQVKGNEGPVDSAL